MALGFCAAAKEQNPKLSTAGDLGGAVTNYAIRWPLGNSKLENTNRMLSKKKKKLKYFPNALRKESALVIFNFASFASSMSISPVRKKLSLVKVKYNSRSLNGESRLDRKEQKLSLNSDHDAFLSTFHQRLKLLHKDSPAFNQNNM